MSANTLPVPVISSQGGRSRQGVIPAALLLVLGLLSAVSPLATDLYLPAFPAMVSDLDASTSAVQLTLTAFLAGVTLGQLVFGPLSDRLGRVPPLVAGVVICVAASVVTVFAPTVSVLIVARLLQGLGGAAGMVIARAVISDLATGKPAAKAFSLMMIVSGVAPVVGPLVGGVFSDALGWRGLLGIVLVLSVVMVIAVLAVVRETHLKQQRDMLRDERRDAGSALRTLRSRVFLGYTAAFGFAFAVLMAFISASPFVYQNMIGLTSFQYGVAFGINALAMMIVSFISAKLTYRVSVTMLLRVGSVLVLAATAALAVFVVSSVPVIWLTVPLFVAVASLGLVLGNATALALGAVPAVAGTASAILGALQYGLAAAVSPLVGLGGEGTALPMTMVMLAAAVVALVAVLVAGRRSDAAPAI